MRAPIRFLAVDSAEPKITQTAARAQHSQPVIGPHVHNCNLLLGMAPARLYVKHEGMIQLYYNGEAKELIITIQSHKGNLHGSKKLSVDTN